MKFEIIYIFETLVPLNTTLQTVSHQILDLPLFFSLNDSRLSIIRPTTLSRVLRVIR